jgi:hypothetical protein
LIGIRAGLPKSYVKVLDAHFVGRGSAMTACAINQSVPQNREQPWHEGALRVIRRAHGVQRQQHVLHEILHDVDAGEASLTGDDLSNAGRNGSQQIEIRVSVPGLRGLHQSSDLVRVRGRSHVQPQCRKVQSTAP